ncbi:MAG TPA: TMEM175 family protein [Methylomirabilota bacterium]|nr:TMEM175 family protein [Methylomirabilota bacterium]
MDQTIRRPRPRIESLSDLIFGLALSIGAISLISRIPATPFRMLIDIAEFGFSFLILISVWMGYTNIMSVLPLESGAVVNLNVVLLFLVSIEPYLFYLNVIFDLSDHAVLLNFASTLYALDMTGLMLILALFTVELAHEERGLVPADLVGHYKRVRDSLFISAALFSITIMPFFWSVKLQELPLRFYFWLIPLVMSFVMRVSGRFQK